MPVLLPTVVETSIFRRKAEKLLTNEEYDDLLLYLSRYYAVGDEIPGTGGVRKLRYAIAGREKSGGVRVIYYFFDEVNPRARAFPLREERARESNAGRKEGCSFSGGGNESRS